MSLVKSESNRDQRVGMSCQTAMGCLGSLGGLESRYNPPTKLKKGEFPKVEIFRHPSSTAMLNS
jgi:hypothetical protein